MTDSKSKSGYTHPGVFGLSAVPDCNTPNLSASRIAQNLPALLPRTQASTLKHWKMEANPVLLSSWCGRLNLWKILEGARFLRGGLAPDSIDILIQNSKGSGTPVEITISAPY